MEYKIFCKKSLKLSIEVWNIASSVKIILKMEYEYLEAEIVRFKTKQRSRSKKINYSIQWDKIKFFNYFPNKKNHRLI